MENWIDRSAAEAMWQKIECKMQKVTVRSRDKLPYTAVNGVHDDKSEQPSWWTNGFWPGINWLLYSATRQPAYLQTARQAQKLLVRGQQNFEAQDHDAGFLWHISLGADYKLTGNQTARTQALYMAGTLASRFHVRGQFLQAWNGAAHGDASIIDSMMNLPLLYWASRETGSPRFAQLAAAHADTVLRCHLRPDGSARHIVQYDPATGEYAGEEGGQGYACGSSWSRGQAWAIYGFTLSYRETHKPEYLDAAKRAAHYFIASTCQDWLPRCDFRSPAEPVIYDASAGAIAASALLALAAEVPSEQADCYAQAGIKLLCAAEKTFCDWNPQTDAILNKGTEAYHTKTGIHMPLIYGDYFLIEAVYRWMGFEPSLW